MQTWATEKVHIEWDKKQNQKPLNYCFLSTMPLSLLSFIFMDKIYTGKYLYLDFAFTFKIKHT